MIIQCRNAERCRRIPSLSFKGTSRMPGIDRDVGTAAALKPTVSSPFSCSVLTCVQLCITQERMMLVLRCRRAQYLKRTSKSLS